MSKPNNWRKKLSRLKKRKIEKSKKKKTPSICRIKCLKKSKFKKRKLQTMLRRL